MTNSTYARVPVGYQQTEIAVIPDDWDVVELQKLCRVPITYGIVQCGPNINDGVPYIRVSDMNSSELDVSGMLRTTKTIAASFARSKVDEGDIVYALRGKLGAVRVVGPSLVGANLTQGTARIAPTSTIFGMYLLWSLRSYRSLKQALQEAKGSTFVEITLADLKTIKIPIPRLDEEQTAIANALSDVDALITSLEKLIAKKRAIKTAAMQQLLTGKKRLPPFDQTHTGYKQTELGEIPEDWEVKPIGSALSIRHGRDQKQVERQDGVYPILGTGGEMGRTDTFIYDKPSVLIGRKGTINKPVYMQSPFWTVDTLFYSEVDKKFSAKFIYYKFCMIDWMAYNEASGVPSLNASTIESVLQSFPNNKDEQVAIADLLSDMDKDIKNIEQRLKKTQQLKQGMMQELLTGKTRLTVAKEEY